MKYLIIPVTLAQEIATYLGNRPYNEVAGLIAAMMQLQPVPDEKSKDPGEKKP
jgi:hypothetical protein